MESFKVLIDIQTCTGPRHGSIPLSTARTRSASRKYCGQRYGERQGDARTNSKSGTSSPIRGAARRFWTSSPPQMWGGGTQPGLSSEASECELRERREREEARRWVPRVRNSSCSSPRPPSSWPLRRRSRESGGGFHFSSLYRFLFSQAPTWIFQGG